MKCPKDADLHWDYRNWFGLHSATSGIVRGRKRRPRCPLTIQDKRFAAKDTPPSAQCSRPKGHGGNHHTHRWNGKYDYKIDPDHPDRGATYSKQIICAKVWNKERALIEAL